MSDTNKLFGVSPQERKLIQAILDGDTIDFTEWKGVSPTTRDYLASLFTGEQDVVDLKGIAPQLREFIDDNTIHDDRPTGLTATASATDQIDLEWIDNSTGETAFAIWSSTTSATAGFTELDTVSANENTYSATGLDPETQYWFKVRAEQGDIVSEFSAVATEWTFLPLPTGLTATADGTDTINLSWTDNATTEDGYKIYRGTESGTLTLIDTVETEDLEAYEDTGLDPDTEYFYAVQAYNSNSESEQSAEDSATTDAEAGTTYVVGMFDLSNASLPTVRYTTDPTGTWSTQTFSTSGGNENVGFIESGKDDSGNGLILMGDNSDNYWTWDGTTETALTVEVNKHWWVEEQSKWYINLGATFESTTDFTNYTQVDTGVPVFGKIRGNGSGLYVGIEQNASNRIMYSSDLASWTESTTQPTGNNIPLDLLVVGTTFVMFASASTLDGGTWEIFTSTDGDTWTSQTNPSAADNSPDIQRIATDGTYVYGYSQADAGPSLIYASVGDLTSWSTLAQPAGKDGAILQTDGTVAAGGAYDTATFTNPGIYTMDDPTVPTWTERQSTTLIPYIWSGVLISS